MEEAENKETIGENCRMCESDFGSIASGQSVLDHCFILLIDLGWVQECQARTLSE